MRSVALLCSLVVASVATAAAADGVSRGLLQAQENCVLNTVSSTSIAEDATALLADPNVGSFIAISAQVPKLQAAVPVFAAFLAPAVTDAVAKVAAGRSVVAAAERLTVSATTRLAAITSGIATEVSVISGVNPRNRICPAFFTPHDVPAEIFASMTIKALAEASNVITFADEAASVADLVTATTEAFRETNGLACSSQESTTEILASRLANLIYVPYFEVFKTAFRSISGFNNPFVRFRPANPAGSPFTEASCTVPVVPLNECPSVFATCCANMSNECSCGSGCNAVRSCIIRECAPAPASLGGGLLLSYNVLEGSVGSFLAGDVCYCL